MAHILDGQLKELSEDASREKAAREVAIKIAKDEIKAVDTAEKKVVATEKAKALVEKRSAKLEAKQNEVDLKLAVVVSLNTV